eukprot:GFKZ01006517.1.p1 GENE.GFKZ01006517.1~~GFKZ01006517.1.p1  ORF type:complete len:237 (+),score=28.21 GFKZ01006517.1:510-1220(+)
MTGCGTPSDPVKGLRDDVVMVETMICAAVDGGVSHLISKAFWTVRVVGCVKIVADRFITGGHFVESDWEGDPLVGDCVARWVWCESYIAVVSALKSAYGVRFADFCALSSHLIDIRLVAAVVADKGDVGHEGNVFEISVPGRMWMKGSVFAVAEVIGREVTFVCVELRHVTVKLLEFSFSLFEEIPVADAEAVSISVDVERVTERKDVSLASRWPCGGTFSRKRSESHESQPNGER